MPEPELSLLEVFMATPPGTPVLLPEPKLLPSGPPLRAIGVYTHAARLNARYRDEIAEAARAFSPKDARSDIPGPWERLRMARTLFNLMGNHATEFRLPETHFRAGELVLRACARAIFKDDYEANLPLLLKFFGCTSIKQNAMVEMGRRNGKTTLLQTLSAILMYIQPNCEICVYSLGKRASTLLARGARAKIVRLGELLGRTIQFKNDSVDTISIVNYYGSVSTMWALPGKAEVRFFLFAPLPVPFSFFLFFFFYFYFYLSDWFSRFDLVWFGLS